MNKSYSHEGQVFSSLYPSPKIVFLYGVPGLSKKQQADRLRTEFGYVHLDMKTLMAQEVKRASVEGQALQKTLEAGLIPTSHLRVNLLIRAFALSPSPSYVITGFLKNLSEALEFEKQICSIKLIANFIIEDWSEYLKRNENHPKADQLESYRNSQPEVLEFYKAFNIVRNVEASAVVERVFRKLKRAIQPELFLLIGVPGCGKTTIGRKMADKYNLTFIDVEKILWEKNVGNQMQKITNDDAITKKLIVSMEQSSSMRFLIEGFPMNLYQLKKFEAAFGQPHKLFYLAMYKEELILRCKRPQISIDYFNYIEKAGSMIDYAENKPYFSRINVNLSFEECIEQIAQVIEPEVVMIANDTNNYLKQYLSSKGYQYFNLYESMQSACSRLTEKGKEIIRMTESGKIVSARLLIKIIQEFIYSGATFGKKFVIGGTFPSKVKELEYIERNCVKVQRMYYNKGSEPIVNYVEEQSLETYMFEQGRFVSLQAEEDYMGEFATELSERVDRSIGKYILVLGCTLSGKSTLIKRYSEKKGVKVVNYDELPELIKAKKSTEEEPYEKVTFQDVLEEIKSSISDPYQTILLDGIPAESLVLADLEVTADDEEIKDRSAEYLSEVYSGFLRVLGKPYLVLHLNSDIKHLKQRLFKKLELGPEDELNEDQIDPLNASIKLDQNLASKFQKLSLSYPVESTKSIRKKSYYEVNTSISEDRSYAYILSVISAKLVLFEEIAQKGILTAVDNICLNNQIAHINIPKLLRVESQQKTERGESIANFIKQRVAIPMSIIISLLKEQLVKLKFGDQLVVLSQFLDAKDPYQYPRTMDMFVSIEELLGEIVGVVTVAPRMKKKQIDPDNIPVVHYPPPKKEEENTKNEDPEEGEEIQQKPPEIELPPRSNPRNPVNLPKMFQLYKRNIPHFVNWDENSSLEDAFKEAYYYVALGKYLSMDDNERLACPNIQIIL